MDAVADPGGRGWANGPYAPHATQMVMTNGFGHNADYQNSRKY